MELHHKFFSTVNPIELLEYQNTKDWKAQGAWCKIRVSDALVFWEVELADDQYEVSGLIYPVGIH